ncbi:hypothetical protein CcI49_06020 [Frankia sp. CcI49]|nr:hypothetical protein ACG83_20295 [Frankia sp. R43]ONH61729.1 hypothetical protein CcI49_06020 [Frankia sp. CcI49]
MISLSPPDDCHGRAPAREGTTPGAATGGTRAAFDGPQTVDERSVSHDERRSRVLVDHPAGG